MCVMVYVVDCNRKGSGLQAAHFQDHILSLLSGETGGVYAAKGMS